MGFNYTIHTMALVACEYTSRVHMVINFIKPKGEENLIHYKKGIPLETTEWIPYCLGVERIVSVACSLN